MRYFLLIVIWVLGTGLAWRRIFSRRYSWWIRGASLGFTLVPLVGPLFYLLIDPPESTPVALKPQDFWHWSRGGRVWPSFDPLIKSLHAMFNGRPEKGRRKNGRRKA